MRKWWNNDKVWFFLFVARYEEQLLLAFFPDEYPAYKAGTISGIPFV